MEYIDKSRFLNREQEIAGTFSKIVMTKTLSLSIQR